MENIIAILVIIAVLSLAIGYIIKEKRNGTKCIGCPSGKSCCNCHDEKDA